MASIVTLRVKVEDREVTQLKTELEALKKLASEIKIDVKTQDALKALNGLTKAQLDAASKVSAAEINAASKRETAQINADAKIKASANSVEIQRTKSAQKVLEAELSADAKNQASKAKTTTAELNNAAKVLAAQEAAAAKKEAAHVQADAKIQSSAINAQAKIQAEILKTERASQRLSNVWKTMFSAFSVGNIVSSAVTRTMTMIRSAFNEAMNEMKELDTALTHYRQVTGASQSEAAVLGTNAYRVGSQYGTSASDYAESVATYARAGYEKTAESLAELSTKTVIVGQTTKDVADQFLLTMDAAYGYGGSVEKLSKVLDGASAIDSTYATTIEKIAAGLGLVAPLAQQVHVSEEELTAAIGTITAVTQRSGAESARALRSLFLNIIGDTTTEIEDGVTATEESVASLQYVMEKYAKSAVDAAKASGEVINPMEAIGALAESMKKGLLTEQQLMDLLSGLGGKLRVSQLVALVSNWDTYNKMIGTYENSMDSADKKVTVYMESWEAKINILKNTWTEFVAKTLQTDTFKGLITGVTDLLKGIGNLRNALTGIVAIFTTIKSLSMAKALADQANQFRLTAAAAAQAGNMLESTRASEQAMAAETKSNWLGWSGIAIGAITAVVTAYNMYYDRKMQQLAEERQEAEKVAKEQQQEALDTVDAYEKYLSAKTNYENGTIAVETYEAAVRNLADALGIERSAIEDVTTSLSQLTMAELEQARVSTQSAIRAAGAEAKGDLNRLRIYNPTTNPVQATYSEWQGTEDQKFQKAIDKYKELADVRDRYLAGDKSVTEDDYNYAVTAISNASDAMGKYIELQLQEREIMQEIAKIDYGVPDTVSADELKAELGEVEEATEAAAEAAEEASNKYDSLAEAVGRARKALEEYQTVTQSEKDDDYSKYADAWKSAFEDIEKGMKNSNAVNAALDLFFTPEQIMKMHDRGVEAADVIASDFWKSIFTYTDDNGNMQFINDDAGANFLWSLYDNLTNEAGQIVDANGKIVASFEEVDGALGVQVDDFKALSGALESVYGMEIDPDVLAVIFEAAGSYSTQINETAEGLKSIAEDYQALTELDTIDMSKLVQGMIDAHKPTEEIMDLIENIERLEAKGEVKTDVKVNLETGKEEFKELIEQRDDLNDKEAVAKVTAETEQAEKDLDRVILKEQQVEANSPTITINLLDFASQKMDELARKELPDKYQHVYVQVHGKTENVAVPYATGTKNAKEGLSLVNEEAPELIVENGIARIAGQGQPTLTWLQSGAEVYNARDTKAILGDGIAQELFKGINAFAGGTVHGVPRYSPNGTQDQETTDQGSTQDYGTQSQGTQTQTQTKQEKKEQSEAEKKQLESLKETVELRKAELELLKEKGARTSAQQKKEQQIYDALKAEYDYLKKHNGSQKELVDLEREMLQVKHEIENLELEHLKDVVALRKSELDLIEAQDGSIKKQIQKQRQIINALGRQLDYMKKIGASREEINKVLEEQYQIEKQIKDLNDSLFDSLEEAINNKIKRLNEKRDAELKKLEQERDTKKQTVELEERQLAVEEARKKLREAKRERTVRTYNASTGQWEWVANANDVKAARENYNEAKKSLQEYKDDQEYEKRVAKINAKWDEKIDKWTAVLKELEDPLITIAQAIKAIEKNATKDQKPEIKALNKVLKALGLHIDTSKLYDSGGVLSGIGGIKATAQDEVVLPPDITRNMLRPIKSAMLNSRMDDLRYLYGVTGTNSAGIMNTNNSNSIGSQHIGDLYTFGNITLTESQAKNTSIYDLVQKSRGLRAYSSAI